MAPVDRNAEVLAIERAVYAPTLSRWRPVSSTRTPAHLSAAHTTLTFSGVSLVRGLGPPSRLVLSDKLVNELVESPHKQSRHEGDLSPGQAGVGLDRVRHEFAWRWW
jgi:hypothetical protein